MNKIGEEKTSQIVDKLNNSKPMANTDYASEINRNFDTNLMRKERYSNLSKCTISSVKEDNCNFIQNRINDINFQNILSLQALNTKTISAKSCKEFDLSSLLNKMEISPFCPRKARSKIKNSPNRESSNSASAMAIRALQNKIRKLEEENNEFKIQIVNQGKEINILKEQKDTLNLNKKNKINEETNTKNLEITKLKAQIQNLEIFLKKFKEENEMLKKKLRLSEQEKERHLIQNSLDIENLNKSLEVKSEEIIKLKSIINSRSIRENINQKYIKTISEMSRMMKQIQFNYEGEIKQKNLDIQKLNKTIEYQKKNHVKSHRLKQRNSSQEKGRKI